MMPGVEITERGPYTATFSGGRFYPFDPRPEEIHIKDIAAALSKLCRFNGHCARFYSVAEHCVIMSYLGEPRAQLWFLMHDAAEAYIGDVVRPIKTDEFITIEIKIMNVIAEKFGLGNSESIQSQTKHYDNVMLATEKRDLMLGSGNWVGLPEPLDDMEIPERAIYPPEAEMMFLRRFYALKGNRQQE